MAVKEVVGLVSRVVEPNGLRRSQVAAKCRRCLLYCLVRQHVDGNYNDRPTAEIWSRKWVSLSISLNSMNWLTHTHTRTHKHTHTQREFVTLQCCFVCVFLDRMRERAGDIERGWAVRVLKYAGISNHLLFCVMWLLNYEERTPIHAFSMDFSLFVMYTFWVLME